MFNVKHILATLMMAYQVPPVWVTYWYERHESRLIDVVRRDYADNWLTYGGYKLPAGPRGNMWQLIHIMTPETPDFERAENTLDYFFSTYMEKNDPAAAAQIFWDSEY